MATKWIQSAIKHHGALHKDLGIPPGQDIPVGMLQEAAKRDDVTGKRARLAITLRELHDHDQNEARSAPAKKPARGMAHFG